MRHVRTAAVGIVALGVVVSLVPVAASAAPRDREPGPGRSTGRPVAADTAAGGTHPGLHPSLHGLGRPGGTGGTSAKVRLVVKADSRAALATARRSMQALGTPRARGLAELGFLTVEVPAQDVAAAVARLQGSPGVASVEVAASRSLHDFTPDDPLFPQQAPSMSAIQAPTAWDSSKGAGAVIAVLDAGFDVTHPDLVGKIAGTYDAVNGDAGVEDTPGSFGLGHGTATATVAAAATNNAQGMAGAAPDASLLLVKVADSQAVLDSAYSAAGIIWAADHGAQVISMSYGGHDVDAAEQAAVAYARARGVVVVASAGNNPLNNLNYPAAFPGVIAVGAATADGTAQTGWSTDGSWVDVAAPAEDITVGLPAAADTDDGVVDGYSRWDGTSFSAPQVAGLAALLRSYRPGAPATTIESRIISTTRTLTNTTGNASFGHGLVQFQSALATTPADVVLTAPTAGAAVQGDVQVTATSGSAAVRFLIVGTGISVKVPVVAGVATATLATYGLDAGGATVRAVACDAVSCALVGSEVPVVVGQNAAPTITAPAAGAALGTILTATASAPAGAAVRFVVDGRAIGTDATAPFSLAYDTFPLADGPHSLVAVLCNGRAPSRCEADNPSPAVAFSVLRLRPTARATVAAFSPNADRRRDLALGTYRLEQTSTVALRVYNAAGARVKGPTSLGVRKAAGTYPWSWNGTNNGGLVQPDGTYTVVITTTAIKAGKVVSGFAKLTVRLDRTRPVLSLPSASPGAFYPVRDGYRDTTSLGVTTREPTTAVTVTIRNSAGAKVRTLTATGTRPAGRVALTWNGRVTGGTLARAGTYTYQVLVQDAAGNRSLSRKGTVTVRLQRLVQKSTSKVIAPDLFDEGSSFDIRCSTLYFSVWQTFPYSHGYFSRDPAKAGTCPGGTDRSGDVVIGFYRYTLPSALRYGTVRISAYAGSHTADGDTGIAEAVTTWGDDGAAWSLGAADGLYSSRALPAADYLRGGRTLHWLAGTADGYSYDVRNFVVSWTYFVLQ